MALFALDHNYPAPIIERAQPYLADVELVSHIENIAARTTPRRPQVWKLSARTGGGEHPDRFFERLAKRAGVHPMDLRKEASPSKRALDRNPLDANS